MSVQTSSACGFIHLDGSGLTTNITMNAYNYIVDALILLLVECIKLLRIIHIFASLTSFPTRPRMCFGYVVWMTKTHLLTKGQAISPVGHVQK